ncbi:uncharacterized protein PFL1_04463 [Pseudozyma flocculosa PF-1]|uniref:Extracellular membrane protein CFEM domain-containing protein n=2 Tax=Pseudozyma flocculosa TaxID=84751 RepID=A0A061HBZ9_9BASI|nr:uncharacterized protein PFL1_04463 [Pseudozyma flocculosa PF-1]EPQ28136.1 hypothetical protein PFL1_04463 [Pseudozyma flocculosa PF-1]SPO41938.1 probable conserved hypothetical Ustilaginaceae-specific protein [Pseudozyma flocculosa]
MVMRFFIVLAILAYLGTAMAAHSAWCTDRKDGTGPASYRITKDCCAATKEHSTTAFNEASTMCMDALGFGNGINLGRFVRCCGDRGAGSHSDG